MVETQRHRPADRVSRDMAAHGKLTQKNNTGARLVRADHEIDPEERPQGDFDQGSVGPNLLRPARHDRLLRGRVRAGRRTLNTLPAKIKADLLQVQIAGAGFWPFVDLISYAFIPIGVHPLIRELRVVRVDDLLH